MNWQFGRFWARSHGLFLASGTLLPLDNIAWSSYRGGQIPSTTIRRFRLLDGPLAGCCC
jgi:hypothetical protein